MRRWATAAGFWPVVACRHVPDAMFVIALDGANEFFQLTVRSRAIFRGATIFRADDFVSLTEVDPRGFRRPRPGAEGLLKLLIKGLDWGGRPRWQNLESEFVLELIGRDTNGVRDAAALFKPADLALVSATGTFRNGRWNRVAILAVELTCGLKALDQLSVGVRRARLRAYGRKRCPVIQASIGNGRRPPKDYSAGWSRVADSHEMSELHAAKLDRIPSDRTTAFRHPVREDV